MKKITGLLFCAVMTVAAVSAQVLPSAGIKNTLWSGFGQQYPEWNESYWNPNLESPDPRFYGLYETVQARVDLSSFTIEGMLNWAAETNWAKNEFKSITFVNTQRTPFWYTNHSNQGGVHTTGETPSYYVNFIWNAIAKDKHDLDFGMGTRLAWKIGPAPACNGYYWEPYTHIVQGGLKEGNPGQADVVGYIHYDNLYANHALGARYKFGDIIEVGASLPSGVTTDKPLFNAAFAIQPVDWLRASVAFENICTSYTDFYSGLTLGFNPLLIDIYLEIEDLGNDDSEGHYKTWGTGAAITWYPVKNLMIKPEAGVTFYRNSDYTGAFYGGGRLEWAISDQWKFGAFSSLAWGASNRYWASTDAKERRAHGVTQPYETTKNWNGGFVFDVRPDITFTLDKHNSLSAAFDYQHRVTYYNKNYQIWATGLYWTYRK